MKTTDFIDQASLRTDIPEFGPGDELKVHVRVVEGGKARPDFSRQRHLDPWRWPSRDLYRSQVELRRRCRTNIPNAHRLLPRLRS